MQQLIHTTLAQHWGSLQAGITLSTPDDAKGSSFNITSVENDAVSITTQGGSLIRINRAAFAEAFFYLAQNLHTAIRPCEIGSNKDINAASALCVSTRHANGSNIMIINYLLPLLAHMGLVGVAGTRPNTTWLL
ncbi:hypothetical protein [Janthinobacterium agaricidamnosum]|uniref:hypothetical protein n=1 Tax=Janthinobacterium agaricidamnosum TaxID=55508 RepID=UPI00118486E9|nr:hypothetical protein [Janthinobacterium agaricidamnosum]